MNKSRIKWIDDAKGFAALLVIIGHIANSHIKAETFVPQQGLLEAVHSFIYMFHMPLFMLLSGFMLYKAYCVNREAKKKNYILQLINIVWLYFFFAVALWVAKMLFSAQVVANVGVKDLIRLPIDPIDETWYLYVLFFLYLLCYAIEKLKFKEELKLGALLAVSMVAEFLPLALSSPWYRILHYAFFFYCGVYLAKKPEGILTKKYVRPAYYIGSVVITVLFFIVGDMAYIEIINLAVAFILSMAVVCIFMGQEGAGTIVHKCLNCTGRYALEVYLLHTYVITVCRVILPRIGIVHFAPNMIISFLLCVLVPIWAVILLKKIKLHTFIFRPVAFLKK
ncbi:MAG: acyltransferase [Clostridia bacterium]|nr:acyltransferase [Clostridia bacterium]